MDNGLDSAFLERLGTSTGVNCLGKFRCGRESVSWKPGVGRWRKSLSSIFAIPYADPCDLELPGASVFFRETVSVLSREICPDDSVESIHVTKMQMAMCRRKCLAAPSCGN